MRIRLLAPLVLLASVLASAPHSRAQDAPASPPAKDNASAVLVLRGRGHGEKAPLQDLEFEVVGPDWRSERAKADRAGRATIRVRPGVRYTVIGRAPGFVRGHALTDVLAAGAEVEASVLLWKAKPIAGTVRSAADGRPVAGATVRVFDNPFFVHPWCGTGRIHDPVPPVEELRTDSEGNFTAHRISMDVGGLDLGTVSILVEAPGFRPATSERDTPADPARKVMDLRMEVGASVHGTVRTPDGKPVAGARVLSLCRSDFALDPSNPLRGVNLDSLELPEGWYVTSEVIWKALRARTGPDGSFTLHGLQPGKTYHAYAVADGWACSAAASDIDAPAAGKSLEKNFVLRRPATVRVVIQGTDGRHPPGTELRLESAGRTRRPLPGPDGSPAFGSLEPGEYSLEVECPGTAPRAEKFALKEGEERDVVIDLAAGAVIEGIVLDDTGTPVPGAEVSAMEKGGPISFRLDSGITSDAQGRFRIPGLRPGLHSLSGGKVKVGSIEELEVAAPATDVRLVMPRFGTFKLCLVRPEGVTGRTTLNWNARMKHFGHGNSMQVAGGQRIPFAEYECLEPGDIDISLRIEGFAPVFRTIRIEPAQTTDLGDIALEKGMTLEGRVEDDHGQPVARAEVRAEFPGWSWDTAVRARTGADGRFRMDHLPRGTLTMKVAADGSGGAICFEEPLTVGPEPLPAVIWVAIRPARIAVVVVDAEGNPLRGVRVRATEIDRTPEEYVQPRVPTDDAGKLEMNLRPGKHRLSLLVGDEFVPVQDVTLEKGEVRDVRLILQPRPHEGGSGGR